MLSFGQSRDETGFEYLSLIKMELRIQIFSLRLFNLLNNLVLSWPANAAVISTAK